MYRPVHHEGQRRSKCFVFVFAIFVFFCAILLIFASVFRVRNPQVSLTSATLNQISYNSSSFKAMVITNLSIKNPNYGGFSFQNSTLSFLYAGVKVGERKINSDRVDCRGSREINVTVNVDLAKVPATGNFSSEINSGTLNLRSYAKISGIVHVLKIFNQRKIVEMACSMDLNLTSHTIQGIEC